MEVLGSSPSTTVGVGRISIGIGLIKRLRHPVSSQRWAGSVLKRQMRCGPAITFR